MESIGVDADGAGTDEWEPMIGTLGKNMTNNPMIAATAIIFLPISFFPTHITNTPTTTVKTSTFVVVFDGPSVGTLPVMVFHHPRKTPFTAPI